MKRRWISVLTVMVFAATLMAWLAVLPNKALAKDKPIIIKIPTITPKSPPSLAPSSQAVAFLKKKLEQKSGGRFKVKVYWSSSLYRDDATQYAALRDNVIQVAFSTGARMGMEIPEVTLLSLPFVFKDMEHFRRFAYGPKGFNPKGSPGTKLFAPLYAKKDYKFIAFWPLAFQNFVSSKGFLTKPEDFKGIKFRIRQSNLAAEITESFGGSAQAIPYMESYTALSLKTVDAAECPLYIMQAVKWHETGDYITLSRHSILEAAVLTNPVFYNGLPEDLKKIFDEAMEEATAFMYKADISLERMMPWFMMSQKPSLQFKWLSEEQRGKLKEHVKPLLDKYRKTIPKEF